MRMIFFCFLIAFFLCSMIITLTEQSRKETNEANRSVQSQAQSSKGNIKN